MGRNKEFSSRPFEKLRKDLDRAASAAVPEQPRKNREDFTDEELFNHEMDDVQIIEAFRRLSCQRHHSKDEPRQAPRDPDHETLMILNEITAGERPINLPDTQEYVEWVNPDYHETILAELHQGRFAVQAFLDLHGFSVPEAEEEMGTFLREAFAKGMSCVKIIHGRGLRSVNGPRLKHAVVRLLLGRFRKDIVAYSSARQCDGGLGALYVLVRKK